MSADATAKVGALGYFKAREAENRGPSGRPFARWTLGLDQARLLAQALDQCAKSAGRERFLLTSSSPDPRRLRLSNLNRTPKYELQAEPNYLRGDVFVVTGGTESCNIDFSPIGAALIADRLRQATDRAKDWIQVVVPNRHRKSQLVEFIADTDASIAAELEKLALAGEAAAAQLLTDDDFSDWE